MICFGYCGRTRVVAAGRFRSNDGFRSEFTNLPDFWRWANQHRPDWNIKPTYIDGKLVWAGMVRRHIEGQPSDWLFVIYFWGEPLVEHTFAAQQGIKIKEPKTKGRK